MFFLTDWLLIITSTFAIFKCYKKIIFDRYASIANYILLVEYVFCCLPILLNYLIGIPEYKTVYWYQPFLPAMTNPNVAIIYDVYILCSFFCLFLYSEYYDKKISNKRYSLLKKDSLFTNKYILVFLITLPFIFIVINGDLTQYLTYGLNSSRGITENNYNIIMSMLILISIYSFCYYVFSQKIKIKTIIIILFYTFLMGIGKYCKLIRRYGHFLIVEIT